MDPRTDRELLAEVARADEPAHRELFRRYHVRVLDFVQRRLADRALCEEVVIDTFFEVWRRAGSFRGESTVATWIFGIAQFKCMLERRKLSREKRSAITVVEDAASHAVTGKDELDEQIGARAELRSVRRLLASLPEAHRRTVELALIEGLPYSEVARQLSISEQTVKTRILRARSHLRAGLPPSRRSR